MKFAEAYENALQLVPNWKAMTMPDTTPMPKASANTLVQKVESRSHTGLPVR